MKISEKINDLHNELVARISAITDRPEGWLPHLVFVEEEGEDRIRAGTPVYKEYRLMDFKADGTCTLRSTISDQEEERHLSEINIDWLNTVLNWYADLSLDRWVLQMTEKNPLEEPLRRLLDVAMLEITCFEESYTFEICEKALASKSNPIESEKELCAFLFPIDRLSRNATDDEIIADWESEENFEVPTQKLTPDEFAAQCNSETFADQIYYVRFINY